MLEEIGLYKIHAFPYSQRKNTKAATYENQILTEVKEQRTKELIALSDKTGGKYRENQIGKNLKVLVEEKIEEDTYKGHTANYIQVKIKNVKTDIKNQIIEAKITKVDKENLIGEMQD